MIQTFGFIYSITVEIYNVKETEKDTNFKLLSNIHKE